jgi:hypothetical protein
VEISLLRQGSARYDTSRERSRRKRLAGVPAAVVPTLAQVSDCRNVYNGNLYHKVIALSEIFLIEPCKILEVTE